MEGTQLHVPSKFTQHELVRMRLNNLGHDLSTAIIACIFEGYDDLCMKAHDMEIHLS